MKTTTLTIIILLFLNFANAQESYIPLKKAKNTTLSIAIDLPAELESLRDYLKENPNIIGLKVNAKMASIADLSTCFDLIKSLPELNTFELIYQTDSLHLEQLSELSNIHSLRLFASSNTYPNLNALGKLSNLESLGLNKISADQLPDSFFSQPNFNELEILQDTINEILATEKVMIYKHNGIEKRIFVTSYNPNCDFYTDSISNILLTKISGASPYVPKAGGNRNQFTSQYPATYYKVPNSFKPIPNGNLSKNTQVLNIDPQVDNSIELMDESILTIPANSLVDSKGNVVKGDVDIFYRTINTPSDIMTTGIPMTFDTAGKTEFFKSNGMFEIKSFSGNTELEVKKGAQFNLNFNTKQDSISKYNLYNISNGQWNSMGFTPNISTSQLGYTTMKDKTSFEERYKSKEYYYLAPITVKEIDAYWNFKSRTKNTSYFGWKNGKKNNYIKKSKNLIKFKTFTDVSDTSNKKLFFAFDLEDYSSKYENTTKRLFPELLAFNNYNFELETYMRSIKFKELYKKNRKYNDIRIYYEPGDEYGTIELKDQKGFTEIRFKTTVTLKKGHTRISKSFLRMYKRYTKLLKMRENTFNQLTTKVYYNTGGSPLIYNIKNTIGPNTRIRYNIGFSLFGLFNFDHIYRVIEPYELKETIFVSKDNSKIDPKVIYVIDGYSQGTYAFYQNTITISEKFCKGIVVVDDNQKVYYINGNTLRSKNYIKRASKSTIEVEEVTKEPIDQLCKRENIE